MHKKASIILVLSLLLTFALCCPVASAAGTSTLYTNFREITSPDDLVNGQQYLFIRETYGPTEGVVDLTEGAAMLKISTTVNEDGSVSNTDLTNSEKSYYGRFLLNTSTMTVTEKGKTVMAFTEVIKKGANFDTCNYGAIQYIDNDTYTFYDLSTYKASTKGPGSGWVYSCYYDYSQAGMLSDFMHIYAYDAVTFTEDDISARLKDGEEFPDEPTKVEEGDVVAVIEKDGKTYEVPYVKIDSSDDMLGGDDQTVTIRIGNVTKTLLVSPSPKQPLVPAPINEEPDDTAPGDDPAANPPTTGDNSTPLLWMGLVIISSVCIVLSKRGRKRG